MWSSRYFLGKTMLLVVSVILQHNFTGAFLPSSSSISELPTSRIIPSSSVGTHFHGGVMVRMSDRDDDNSDSASRLRDLGYSDDEIQRSTRKPAEEPRKVRVDMVDNVDATTLTVVGFAAIAFNFFVLANMGDGGIGGIVARIINSF